MVLTNGLYVQHRQASFCVKVPSISVKIRRLGFYFTILNKYS